MYYYRHQISPANKCLQPGKLDQNSFPKKRNMNKQITNSFRIKKVLPLFSLFILILLSHGCTSTSENDKTKSELIPVVEAVQSQYGSLPLVERLSGVVKAKNQVDIYSEINAIIQKVLLQNGAEVKKSDPLVELRNIEYQEQYNQAEAELQIANAKYRQAEAKLKEINNELNRGKTLSEKGLSNEAALESIATKALSAEADVELAQAEVNQAKANVAENKERLLRTIIRAPIDGVVGNRNAEVGMTVSSNTRLFTIGMLDTVRVEIILTDRMLQYIKSGQRAEIFAENLPNGAISAPLSRISPFLHPVTHSTEADIELYNQDHYLKSGMFTTVDIFYGESDKATIVPLSAIYENPMTGETGVYIANDTANKLSDNIDELKTSGFSEPVPFEFVPIEILAKGRLSAGVTGIDPQKWVVTIGQDLFGGEPGMAKLRPVNWTWVEHLQNLQREDLLQKIVGKKNLP